MRDPLRGKKTDPFCTAYRHGNIGHKMSWIIWYHSGQNVATLFYNGKIKNGFAFLIIIYNVTNILYIYIKQGSNPLQPTHSLITVIF